MLFCSVDPYLLYKVGGGWYRVTSCTTTNNTKKKKLGQAPPLHAEAMPNFFFRSGKQTLPSGTKKAIRDHQKYPLHAEAMPNFFLPRAALGPISPPRNTRCTRGNTLHHYKQQTTQKKQLVYLIQENMAKQPLLGVIRGYKVITPLLTHFRVQKYF